MDPIPEPQSPRPSGRVLGFVVVLLALGAAAYFFLPGLRARVDAKFGEVAGWNDEARRSDPVGFIDFSIKKLGDNIDKFEQVRRDLSVQRRKVEELQKGNDTKLAFANKQLDEFKAAYKNAGGATGKSWPVTVAGRPYSEAELKQQVNLLLTQRTAYEEVAKISGEASSRTTKSENDVVGRITESKAKLDVLKTQRELVKAAKLTADTEKLMDEVHEILVENEAIAAQSPVRTVDELIKDAERESPAANANVDAFLNG